MPRKKVVEVKTPITKTRTRRVKVEEPTVDPFDEPTEEVEVHKEDRLTMPMFEGVKVLRILEDNHTKTHFHCKFEDGTTRHVPREMF